jgi:N,N'-diacetylchitobiose transport system permease protein
VRRRRTRRLAANAAAVVLALVWIFPVYWMVTTALKPEQDVTRLVPKLFPHPVTFHNFALAMGQTDEGGQGIHVFWTGLRNSLAVTLAAVACGLLVSLLAALALGRFKFRGRKLFLVLLIVAQMIPGEALFVPFWLILNGLHATGSLITLTIVYLSFVLPFTTWMLRGFVLAVPLELEEAALVDGATRWRAFWRVLFPLIGPGILATSIFGFITAWNEFTYAYVLLNTPQRYTLPVWLQSFVGVRLTSFSPMMAMATLFTLPVVVFFLFVQRRAVAGLTAGAVKG